jgi:hypothetical protein
MNGYLITFFILVFLSLGIKLAKHGEPEEGKYNFFLSLLSACFTLWLLYMGGCFNNINL